ncbi:MAG: hypothetical protein CME61_00910 [Halobacteriovoraceae bacterium]|nr:hypothetical protein [Halobacteriovoraceae bacterium]
MKKIALLISFSFFTIGFLLNAPVEQTINSTVEKNLPSKCKSNPINFSLSFFPLPTLSSHSISISSLCSGLPNDLYFKGVELKSRGLSFSPFGLKFKVSLQTKKNKTIDLFLAVGFGGFKIVMDNTLLPNEIFSSFAGNILELEGDLNLNLISRIDKKGIKELSFKVKGVNISLPGQSISGFSIPTIDLDPIELKGNIDKRKNLKLESISVGSENNNLKLRGKGNISNIQNFKKSTISFLGSLQIFGELKTQFGFLNLVFGEESENGGFEFELTGPIQAPRIKSLN